MTYTEGAPDYNNGMGTVTIEAVQDNPIQHTEDTVIDLTMTHHTDHTTYHPHTAGHQVTVHRIAVDHIHAHPTDCQNITHTKEGHTVQDHTPIKKPKNQTLEGIGRSR